MAKVKEQEAKSSPVGGILKGLLITGLAVGAAAIANAYVVYKTPPLLSALEGGEVRYFPTPDGDIFFKKRGSGPPLLLVHGIGAGCSSFEFRKIWKSLSESHTVYALDLLGFGKSDKPAISYTDETFINLLSDFCKHVIGVGDGRGEADVIASSLSAAYVIALSQRDPSLFHRLILVCPTGIEELMEPVNAGSATCKTALKTPIAGTSFYNMVTSRAAIRKYLTDQIYADPSHVTPEVVDAYYTAAHQPGADNVLPFFISGYMNINVSELFKGVVDLPLIVWGREAKQSPVDYAEPFLLANPNAKLEIIEEAGVLPHDEQPEAFLAAVHPFLLGASEEAQEADNSTMRDMDTKELVTA
jgi:pimeloyl-ACP methyl ester carboxylesterase